MNKSTININNQILGSDNHCFIIAEIGINYDQNIEQAFKLIDAAANAGCSAVKFQLFSASRMYPPNAGLYQTASGKKKQIVKIIKDNELVHSWIPKLKKYTHLKKLGFIVTTCDEKSTDILEKYDIDAYKIASYEITHIPLLQHVSKKNRPVIFSCAAATLAEVAEAREVFRNHQYGLGIMHCVGQYPADPKSLNLNIIKTLQFAFPDVVVGYSDHTSDPIEAPKSAIILGAKIIEKHITLDRSLPGPDHSFALEPHELKKMVDVIRDIEKKINKGTKINEKKQMLGSSERKTYPNETKTREFTYRTIFATTDIKKGEKITKKNTAVLRPGSLERGLDPKYWNKVLNHKATKNIRKFHPISWRDILI